MMISVVLPAYNAERFVAEAIESVLTQTYTNFELILIDDGSTDSTLEILRSYEARDSRVKVVSHENVGVSASMNQALDIAQSIWIARMDSDDIMETRRLERGVAFISEYPDLAVTSCLVTYIDATGRVLGRSVSDLTTDDAVRKAREESVVIGFHQPGALMRRDVVMGVGGYRPEFVSAQDIDLWNRIADTGGRILIQPEYLLRYRIHGTQTTVSAARMTYLRTEWIKQSTLSRRQGIPEPSFDTFLEGRREQPIYKRVNAERRLLARVFYKQATLAYSFRQPLKTVGLSALSSLLDPTYAPHRIRQRLR